MPLNEPVTPGIVDWTGENPGILLKNDDDSFAAMALFFFDVRIVRDGGWHAKGITAGFAIGWCLRQQHYHIRLSS